MVGKFVEFMVPAWILFLWLIGQQLNMAPEYGAICGFFPIDVKHFDIFEIQDEMKSRCLGGSLCEGERILELEGFSPVYTIPFTSIWILLSYIFGPKDLKIMSR